MKSKVKTPIALLDFLLGMMDTASKSKSRKMIKHGLVHVDGRVATRPDEQLKEGQVVKISRPEAPKTLSRDDEAPCRIIHEDEAIIVAQKPAGLLSIATDKEKIHTMHALLYKYIQSRDNGRVYLVHRLDRDVAGLMVFAKSSDVKTDLQLNWGDAEKHYVALVEGRPAKPEARIATWMEEVTPYKMGVCEQHPDAKYSITEYETIEELEGHTLLDIKLHTGRRHQIRAHLAHLGCPIVGDPVYGTPAAGKTEVLLFAYLLRFRHPQTGRSVTFEVEVPKNYLNPPEKKELAPGEVQQTAEPESVYTGPKIHGGTKPGSKPGGKGAGSRSYEKGNQKGSFPKATGRQSGGPSRGPRRPAGK